eukprot:Amastigsp_a520703_7.p4 type:complete len:117 gc:universal Amastigsp_a520703_7:370-20(-)
MGCARGALRQGHRADRVLPHYQRVRRKEGLRRRASCRRIAGLVGRRQRLGARPRGSREPEGRGLHGAQGPGGRGSSVQDRALDRRPQGKEARGAPHQRACQCVRVLCGERRQAHRW